MKGRFILKGLVVIFCMLTLPQLTMAKDGKPLPGIKIDYGMITRMIADTTRPETAKKSTDKKEGKSDEQTPVQVVKVIPPARRQSIPVPVKINVHPVKIIKPVVKPIIRILH
ncbi:MAG: hypothetical protein KGM16_10795 [Bacteroidota bacterium]|nr:hypothetical protein [Bacteroidota bacterium]